MAFKLLADENLHGDILRGLFLRNPDLDIVRAQDVALSGAEDREVLAWAAGENRIVVTHDGATMPDHAFDRIDAGENMPGVFVIRDRLSVVQRKLPNLGTMRAEPGEFQIRASTSIHS